MKHFLFYLLLGGGGGGSHLVCWDDPLVHSLFCCPRSAYFSPDPVKLKSTKKLNRKSIVQIHPVIHTESLHELRLLCFFGGEVSGAFIFGGEGPL
jgi:hypothetical protein